MDAWDRERWLSKIPYGGPVAKEAVRALAEEHVVEAIPVLVSALRRAAAWEDGEGAHLNAEAIAAIGGAVAVDALIGLLLAYTPEEREEGNCDVSDEHRRARRAVECALAQLGAPALPELRRVLGHPNRDAAHSAARVLGQLRDLTSLDTLVAWAAEPDEDHIDDRNTALEALGGYRDPRALSTLRDAFENDQERHRRADSVRIAASALGRTADPDVLQPLIEALSHHDWWVRAAACEGLGAFGGERASAALEVARSDPDERVRVAAARGLDAV
ncbi:MAG: HEAT repeat domain-containing protein [Kofleriaceae bacterium]